MSMPNLWHRGTNIFTGATGQDGCGYIANDLNNLSTLLHYSHNFPHLFEVIYNRVFSIVTKHSISVHGLRFFCLGGCPE